MSIFGGMNPVMTVHVDWIAAWFLPDHNTWHKLQVGRSCDGDKYCCKRLYPMVQAENSVIVQRTTILLPKVMGFYTGKLMMGVEEISDHFWRETPWGRAMKDQLSNPPQPK